MPRLRNEQTGVVVNVDDDTASRLPAGWVPHEATPVDSAPVRAKRTRATKKEADDGSGE